MSDYGSQTVHSKNPFARFAHRSRIEKSICLARRLATGRILDYGCGSGLFVERMNRTGGNLAVGYEPFMDERTANGLPIFREYEAVRSYGPFLLITLFETVEHLTDEELAEFLSRCSELLAGDGELLISAPIEIGPALFLKEMNRSLRSFAIPDYQLGEFLKAGIFGIAARRAPNVKLSHRGFDFRQAIRKMEFHGWRVSVLEYGPLPLPGWYGNSQVYLTARKHRDAGG
ncbi:MAG TPA: methyltransferase domain-containing protein [Steroidobacteraceae bacterium]|nr:methyltransferase domain-containing protein [Steroidobacteraceae bacterium]